MKEESVVVPVARHKDVWESGGVSPLFLFLTSALNALSGNFTPQPYNPGNIAPRPRLNSKLGESESRSGRFEQETNIFLLSGFDRRLFQYANRSRFTVGLHPDWSLSPTVKTRLLSLNRTQPGVVFSLCILPYNLKIYLYWMRMTNSPVRRRCGAGGRNLSPRFV
jgi:hypothetical protein